MIRAAFLALALFAVVGCSAQPAQPTATSTAQPSAANAPAASAPQSTVGPTRPTPAPPTVTSGSLLLRFTLAGTDQAITDGACPSGLLALTPASQEKCLAHGVTTLYAEATSATGALVFQLAVFPAADQILVLDQAGSSLYRGDGNILAAHAGDRFLSFSKSDVYSYLLRLDYQLRTDGSYDLGAVVCGRNESGSQAMSLAAPSVFFDTYRTSAVPVAFGIAHLEGAPITSASAELGGYSAATGGC